MAVISAVAEHADLASRLTNKTVANRATEISPQAISLATRRLRPMKQRWRYFVNQGGIYPRRF